MFGLSKTKEVTRYKRFLLASAILCGLLITAVGFTSVKLYASDKKLHRCQSRGH